MASGSPPGMPRLSRRIFSPGTKPSSIRRRARPAPPSAAAPGETCTTVAVAPTVMVSRVVRGTACVMAKSSREAAGEHGCGAAGEHATKVLTGPYCPLSLARRCINDCLCLQQHLRSRNPSSHGIGHHVDGRAARRAGRGHVLRPMLLLRGRNPHRTTGRASRHCHPAGNCAETPSIHQLIMNTLTYSRTASLSAEDAGRALEFQRRTRKLTPLAAIVVGHAVVFYLAYSGMLRSVTHAIMPQVVNVTFVASPEPLKAAPQPPKEVPLVLSKQTFVPPLPQLNIVQTEPTITLPPPQPRPADPAPAHAAPSTAQAAPPAPPLPSTPKTVSGVEYVRAPQPVYPSIARRMGETGTVMLRVLIGEKGNAEQVTVQKSSGSANLDEAGRQAVLRALYKPYVEDGKAVPVYVLVPINFQLG
ncbi:Protein tonB, putative [Ricinus communis]|uniref:Protein tonB, putative n=1 Tax=Ricinus communis TaxID=3988 RepID=B9TF56_RICCO|nr:Protein tonB, putative [Ricinus communis]